MDDDNFIMGAFFIGMILGAFLSGCAVHKLTTDAYQKESIERGIARFHPETGAWEWTVEPVKKKAEKESK
jgi:hypothetical protein